MLSFILLRLRLTYIHIHPCEMEWKQKLVDLCLHVLWFLQGNFTRYWVDYCYTQFTISPQITWGEYCDDNNNYSRRIMSESSKLMCKHLHTNQCSINAISLMVCICLMARINICTNDDD